MTIIDLDHAIFKSINHGWSSPVLDDFFVTVTDLHKVPLFMGFLAVVFIYCIYKYKIKKVSLFIIQLLLLVGLTDAISYYGIKQSTYRHRPNNHPEVSSLLKMPYSPQSSSMPSNHATNSFAMATFIFSKNIYIGTFMYFLASVVALSRVYVGVHFPSDVFAGAFFGILLATLYIKAIGLINRKYKKNKSK